MQRLFRERASPSRKAMAIAVGGIGLVLFWPTILTYQALCRDGIELDKNEEIAATVAVFLTNFLWLVMISCAINTYI